jgi:hypothetical protein
MGQDWESSNKELLFGVLAISGRRSSFDIVSVGVGCSTACLGQGFLRTRGNVEILVSRVEIPFLDISVSEDGTNTPSQNLGKRPVTRRHIPEERIPRYHRCSSRKVPYCRIAVLIEGLIHWAVCKSLICVRAVECAESMGGCGFDSEGVFGELKG